MGDPLDVHAAPGRRRARPPHCKHVDALRGRLCEPGELAALHAALDTMTAQARQGDEAARENAELRARLANVRRDNGALTVQLGRAQQAIDELRDELAALRAVAEVSTLRRLVDLHQPETVTILGGGDCGRGFGEPGSGCCGACDLDVETSVCACGAGLDVMPCPTLAIVADGLGVALGEWDAPDTLAGLIAAALDALPPADRPAPAPAGEDVERLACGGRHFGLPHYGPWCPAPGDYASPQSAGEDGGQ